MDLAKIKLKQMSEHGDLCDRYGACIRVYGQRELLSSDVLQVVDRAVKMTEHNNKAVLNICFPYTSREEITSAIRSTVEDWSTPLVQPALRRERRSPFKEERIANTIRSQHLSDHQRAQSPLAHDDHLSLSVAPRSPSSSTTSLSSADHDHDSSSVSSSTTLHADLADGSAATSAAPDPHQALESKPSLPMPMTTLLPSSPSTTTTTTAATSPSLARVFPSAELITSATITSHLYTKADPPLDLLIRTSGVERLSDFMLWQSHETTEVVFLKVLWPEFDLWSFLPVLWEWQWRQRRSERFERERMERERGLGSKAQQQGGLRQITARGKK